MFKSRLPADISLASASIAGVLGTIIGKSKSEREASRAADGAKRKSTKKKTKKKKPKTLTVKDFRVHQRDLYDRDDEVLAAVSVNGFQQYYAGHIYDQDTVTGLYTVRFLDSSVRNDVKVKEILCSGWFRKGMDVYALFKDGGTIHYLGIVTSTSQLLR